MAGRQAVRRQGEGAKTGSISAKNNMEITQLMALLQRCYAGEKKTEPGTRRYSQNDADLVISMWSSHPQTGGRYLIADRNRTSCWDYTNSNMARVEEIAPFQKRYHSHDYFEMTIVLDGELEEWIEGKKIRLRKGDCVLLDKNIRHVERLDRDITCVYLGIKDSCIENLLFHESPGGEQQGILQYLLSRMEDDTAARKSFCHFQALHPDGAVEAELNEMLGELLRKQPGYWLMIQGRLRRIFGILDAAQDYRRQAVFDVEDSREELMAQIHLVMETAQGTIGKEELAERFHYNAAYLCRLIRDYYGMSFTRYSLSVRLKAAADLLRHSDWTVAEICEHLSFSNRTYFYRAFEAVYALTPAEYRDHYRGR
ncbi:MAG: AraC family transcriptional regulator [Eubacteriales bacterium]|nr:AraC family transcriptional regulator [Eubacteriales bacterium]